MENCCNEHGILKLVVWHFHLDTVRNIIKLSDLNVIMPETTHDMLPDSLDSITDLGIMRADDVELSGEYYSVEDNFDY